MAISAVVAVGDAGDALVARLKQKAREIKVGPGRDTSSDMGPVVTAQARDRVAGYVDRGKQAGATLVVDGRGLVVNGHEDGFFVGPTPVRPGHHRHGHLHRRDLRPGAGGRCAPRPSPRRST